MVQPILGGFIINFACAVLDLALPRSRTRIRTKSGKSFLQAWLAKREMVGQYVRPRDRRRGAATSYRFMPTSMSFLPSPV